jgi:hypothetical protein
MDATVSSLFSACATRQPVAPRVVPANVLIRNHHDVRDWEHFLG